MKAAPDQAIGRRRCAREAVKVLIVATLF